ncbi:MAG: tetrahydromethanopterin S-methyltransferase subunit A [Nitrososphaera sp.]|uniref:tetrahydromethanopterin S-methyltransferase subunit A n=1 Tax=Nitrososphaera sp. TaxID=1971748 RepID=UPI003D6E180E
MTVRKKFDDVAGKICEAVIPVKHESFVGKGSKVAVCTLGSIGLLEEISQSDMMERVAIAGRLLSENRGIDAIVQYALSHPSLERIVLCGREVKGHMPGQALLSLYKNGVDSQGRIIGAQGPYPTVESTMEQVDRFRKQVGMIDMVGVTDISQIIKSVA